MTYSAMTYLVMTYLTMTLLFLTSPSNSDVIFRIVLVIRYGF